MIEGQGDSKFEICYGKIGQKKTAGPGPGEGLEPAA
jgi:hypothetical protein